MISKGYQTLRGSSEYNSEFENSVISKGYQTFAAVTQATGAV